MKGTGGSAGADAGAMTAGETDGETTDEDGGQTSAEDSGTGGSAGAGPSWLISYPLDQTKEYLFGVLEPATCKSALALVSEPDKYAVGFPCDVPNRLIIVKGDLYYETINGLELHQFAFDLTNGYPGDPFGNDPKLNAPCSALITGFVMSPKRRLLYHCLGLGWHNEGGDLAYDGDDEIVALNDGDVVATTEGVMSLRDGVLHAVPQLASTLGVRVHGNTFHVASSSNGTGGALWSVDASGKATNLGSYAGPPAGAKLGSLTRASLAADDSLYVGGLSATTKGVELIYRAKTDGTSEIVYTMANKPTVQMYGGSPLVTGP